MKNPKIFGVWGNIEKDAFWNVLPKIINWAKDKNLELFLTEKISQTLEPKNSISLLLIPKIKSLKWILCWFLEVMVHS